jgi:hypothetical protein
MAWTSLTRWAKTLSPRPRGGDDRRIFDELLAGRTVPGRPADLTDDMAWIRAASGPHLRILIADSA